MRTTDLTDAEQLSIAGKQRIAPSGSGSSSKGFNKLRLTLPNCRIVGITEEWRVLLRTRTKHGPSRTPHLAPCTLFRSLLPLLVLTNRKPGFIVWNKGMLMLNLRMDMKKLMLMILVTSATLFSVCAQSLQPQTVRNIKASTVFVDVRRHYPLREKEMQTSGTGFFISPHGHIATSFHVVAPVLGQGVALLPAPVDQLRVLQHSGSPKHKSMSAYILAVDKENDLALLGINEQTKTPYLTIGSTTNLIETMPIWAFGYPFGDAFAVLHRGPEITVTKGSISALRHDDLGVLRQIQVDAVVNPGNSGGPLVDRNGHVLGVAYRSMGPARMNFAIPTSALTNLIAELDLTRSGPDEVTLDIATEPAGATLYLDWQAMGETPLQVTTNLGWHTLCLLHEGNAAAVMERSFLSNETLRIAMPPVKAISLDQERASKEEHPPILPKLAQLVTAKTTNYTVLLSESFDDPARFEQWEQSTGGVEKRTWFLDKGALHQYEKSSLLHAIHLGDEKWDNYLMKARVKINDEHNDSRAGLIFRDTDDGFYLFRIHKETDKAQLAYHCKKPFGWFILREKKLDQDIDDDWNDIAVCIAGSTVACFLNGQPVFQAPALHASHGSVGFYSVESKASFDDLLVARIESTPAESVNEDRSMISFWFTDDFNNESTWWYPSCDDKPDAWRMTMAGFIQKNDNPKTRRCEFTKYLLKDFTIRMFITLGKSKDNSAMRIYYRKTGDNRAALEITDKHNAIRLLKESAGKITVLENYDLEESLFDEAMNAILTVNGSKVSFTIAGLRIIDYDGKDLPNQAGLFGVEVDQMRCLLQQMTVTSIQTEDPSGDEPTQQRRGLRME